MSLRVNASGARVRNHDAGTLVNADFTLTMSPRQGHEVSIRARSAGYGALRGAEPALRLAYSLPIGVPIGRSHDGGRLVGRVYDIESGRGVRNATVLVGDQIAITDDQGRVEINGVPAGLHYLHVDLGAAASQQTSTQLLPRRIAVRDGATARVELPVARTISITGSVRRLSPHSIGTWDGSRATLTDTTYLRGVMVTLSRDGETHTRITDTAGVIAAAGLRPGRWTINVSEAELPAHHYLETSPMMLDIAPGQHASAHLDVLPRKRTLVLVDQAEIIADHAATTAVHPAHHTPYSAGQSFYVVGKADRTLENIALIIYGESALWPKLWLANRHQLAHPDEVRAGTFLVIPLKSPLTSAEIEARDTWRNRGRPDQ
jgi:hypothetical protein